MNEELTKGMSSQEIELACKLWDDLKSGVSEAHTRLQTVSEAVRDAILKALVADLDRQEFIKELSSIESRNPFC
ncbi:MAG: hypothetical protein EOP04_06440 [Proteobacteria bacterium]|nr:MAG: hypothetical protein EOP04_06440 [Pseudomonadota bacterium]